MRRAACWLLSLTLMGVTTVARADIRPANAKRVDYSYGVANLAEHPAWRIVMYPRACGSDGKAVYADLDLALNPHLRGRVHDVDYEVLSDGQRYEIGRFCDQAARLYALPAADFPAQEKVAKEREWMRGWEAGERYTVLPALDALAASARAKSFETDARLRRSTRPFATVGFVRAPTPIKAVHDVLLIRSIGERGLQIEAKEVVYEYNDGTTETLAYANGRRPKPSRGSLRPVGFGDSEGEDDAGEDESPAPSSVAAEASARAPQPVREPPANTVKPVRRRSRGRAGFTLVALAVVMVGGAAWWLVQRRRGA